MDRSRFLWNRFAGLIDVFITYAIQHPHVIMSSSRMFYHAIAPALVPALHSTLVSLGGEYTYDYLMIITHIYEFCRNLVV